jgi:hypothetical protein
MVLITSHFWSSTPSSLGSKLELLEEPHLLIQRFQSAVLPARVKRKACLSRDQDFGLDYPTGTWG